MAHQIKPKDATALLSEVFPLAEDDNRDGVALSQPKAVITATERLFSSKTQAYRQALVGCAVARILDQAIDIRFPAT